MQLVVPSAVTKAVRAATITFTTTSINRFFFISFLRGHDGHGHYGQNRKRNVKNRHYNINIIIYI